MNLCSVFVFLFLKIRIGEVIKPKGVIKKPKKERTNKINPSSFSLDPRIKANF